MNSRRPDPTRARQLRRTSTDTERHLWKRLKDRQISGAKFRRQVSLGPFVVDFVSFEARLIVEVDGGQHADSERDAERSRFLESQGFRVLRFWNNDVLADIEGVIRLIERALLEPGR